MIRLLQGDCREVLGTLPEESVQCCVTSPPYWGLRDYGVEGQIGLEETPEEYVATMVGVFSRLRHVLRDDGTVWLNLGDSYARAGGDGACGPNASVGNTKSLEQRRCLVPPPGLKPKDLVGIPWRVALALQADGWWLRSDIIWSKPNPMPESVTDRPTKAHEYVFLLSKSEHYYYDANAIREPSQPDPRDKLWGKTATTSRHDHQHDAEQGMMQHQEGFVRMSNPLGRNARSVWTIATQPFPGAHFATFPEELAVRCLRAGTRVGDMVLDPFGGSGTVGLVADKLARNAILIDLSPEYIAMAAARIHDDAPLLAKVEADECTLGCGADCPRCGCGAGCPDCEAEAAQ